MPFYCCVSATWLEVVDFGTLASRIMRFSSWLRYCYNAIGDKNSAFIVKVIRNGVVWVLVWNSFHFALLFNCEDS